MSCSFDIIGKSRFVYSKRKQEMLMDRPTYKLVHAAVKGDEAALEKS